MSVSRRAVWSVRRPILGVLACGGLGFVGTAIATADSPSDEDGRRQEAPRVAAADPDRREISPRIAAAPAASDPVPAEAVSGPDALPRALRLLEECRSRMAAVRDYTCTFTKRERVGGRLTAPHVMAIKVRQQPFSVYMKFHQPNQGREAIYVEGRHAGKVVAHDVGLGKLVAGTMRLDPKGSMAMEENRHPISEIGLAHLVENVSDRWARDLQDGEARITVDPLMRVGDRPVVAIESVHEARRAGLLFHRVRLYLDRELMVPIRFEAYDWPKRPGAAPDLLEEYTYAGLRLNPALTEKDFDPNNKAYSYGRF